MASNTADTPKQALRARLLRERRETLPEEKARIDRAVFQRVTGSAAYRAADTIFAYWSTAEELDTHAIIADALAKGKRVCVPKCLPGHRMVPRRIRSEADLTEETFGIPEPGAACAEVPAEEISLCLIPALACDRTGARLGYGGGFYDRFLTKTPAYRMVLCAGARVLRQVPAETHDVRCDCIVTENEVIPIHER